MKRVLLSVLAASLIPLFYWLGGFDFDARGVTATTCAIFTIYIGCAVYMFQGLL